MKPPALCGTYRGHRQHVHNGEEPCEECKEAFAAYAHAYREAFLADYEDEKQTSAARSRALRCIAIGYPGDQP